MYNLMTQHFYSLQSDDQDKSSNHHSPYEVSVFKTHAPTATLDVEWVCAHTMLGPDGGEVPTMSFYLSCSSPQQSCFQPEFQGSAPATGKEWGQLRTQGMTHTFPPGLATCHSLSHPSVISSPSTARILCGTGSWYLVTFARYR